MTDEPDDEWQARYITKRQMMLDVQVGWVGLGFLVLLAHRVWNGEWARANPWLVLGLFVLGIVLHELIHAIVFLAVGMPRKEISFGIKWRDATPYVHCGREMRASQYRTAVIAPFLVLGIVPAAIGIWLDVGLVTWFAALLTGGAVGDLMILVLLRDVPNATLVKDHPSEPGALVRRA